MVKTPLEVHIIPLFPANHSFLVHNHLDTIPFKTSDEIKIYLCRRCQGPCNNPIEDPVNRSGRQQGVGEEDDRYPKRRGMVLAVSSTAAMSINQGSV